MRHDIYETLIDLARSKKIISYDDLNKKLNLGLNFDMPPDRDLIGHWLGEIAKIEVKEGRHMLSALVVHKKGEGFSDPGKGFYSLAKELGIYAGNDDLGFWTKEVKWLHDYWSKH